MNIHTYACVLRVLRNTLVTLRSAMWQKYVDICTWRSESVCMHMHRMHRCITCRRFQSTSALCLLFCHIILSFNIALILTMPLTRTFSFTALNVLNNLDDAPPAPSSVSCHSQTPAVSLPCKPFVKPPTIPFDRLSFIRRPSPLAPSDNFLNLSVLPPPKRLVPLKPRLDLYRNTLLSYWHREFSKKCAAKKRAVQGRVIMKHTPKKSITTVASLLVEKAGKGFENAAVQR
jgi:hypothetical protein